MKKIFKISAVFFVGLSIIVSSCKKEELIIEGCTDSSAMNYLATATSDDGGCVFAYKIAQGDWAIDTSCDSVTISVPFIFEETISITEIFPDSVEITGEENNVVSMDINGNNILADIANDGSVTIQDNQTISFDTNDFDPTIGALIGVVDINITVLGIIISDSNGNLLLNLSNSSLSIDADCEIIFLR